MVARRTVDLLPEIFRTPTNKKFLGATLDQLTQEPAIKRTQGFVGRRVGPGVNPADVYVIEPDAERTDYQLEPGVIFSQPETTRAIDAITYPGMLSALDLQGAKTQRQDRLFQSEYYAWDPFCDLDKFSNYSQYYWLPLGPDSVDISAADVPSTDGYTVTRLSGAGVDAYQFSDVAGDNPVLTLVRGGTYTFSVNQPGIGFWIQSNPGVSGRLPSSPNISSRDVLGVVNNGEDAGTVTFNVPQKTAQDFFYSLTDIGRVDLITDLKFNQINNVYVSEFLAQHPQGIDGITNLRNRTLVFTNAIEDAQDGGWQITTQFDPLARMDSNNGLIGSYDTTLFDQTTDITSQADRYSVWQVEYVFDNQGANPYLRLNRVLAVPELSKFQIQFGTRWANTSWYKNASGYFEKIPLLTAVLDTLWYQDGRNPEIRGQIKLIEAGEDPVLDIENIIGAKNYTSPNGVVLTNGLKVQIRGKAEPAQFQNLEYYVEGVGTGPGIEARVGFVNGQAYFGASHVFEGVRYTGSMRDANLFQQIIYDNLVDSLANMGSGGPANAALPTMGILNATQGNGIKLIPVSDLVTPEVYTQSQTDPFDTFPYDSTPYDETLNAPEIPDYLTINRASEDRNAWSRSNRWFHVDVIRATAQYNNQIPVLNNDARAKRPIVEFRANMKLYNFGTQGKTAVDVIDFQETDALSNVQGSTSYDVNGYTFIDGSRVIFAADIDPQVRNRIYQVKFIDPTGSGPFIIDLEQVDNAPTSTNQTVVCLTGNTLQGVSFWFDGADWIQAQQKTGVNQAPLFDVYDISGHSFGDATVYPSTSFQGSRLFGYALGGTQITDAVLGFSLKFLNINNVGDIVFQNYFYTDTFTYVEGSVGTELEISTGYARQYTDRVSFTSLLGWQTAAAENRSRQVFRFVYADEPLVLDVPVDQNSVFPPLQIFLGTEFVDPTSYSVVVNGNNTVITLVQPPELGTVIEVQALSNVASNVAFYQVPLNLESNPLNQNSPQFTLGTVRSHYETIGQNLKNIQGPVIGANNTRDLGNILIYGDLIVQNSSPLTLTGVFLRQQQYELFSAITFNSQEYEKYKARMINLAAQGDYVNNTPTQILDQIILEMGVGRDNNSAFYWSDMLPASQDFTENVYVYSPISTPVFDTLRTYDFTSSNFQGILVYLNGSILTQGYDYEVGVDSRTITITTALSVGDQIVIREYATTYGTYVPNTPTKMGLYPAYKPEMYLDTAYLEPTMVIRGHDGSVTVAYGDFRDQVLLEFETRIFNNLKIKSEIPIQAAEVIPGQFRLTNYSLSEINEILAPDFLSWVGWNKLDYTSQFYLQNDAFTYNYSQSSDRLTGQPLLGAWRGIYNYFYDTDAPTTRPWEMLGFSEEPTWWQDTYGPAPYTSGNMVLWDDLAEGLVNDPNGAYVLLRYARPGLPRVIPADSEGRLLPPLETTVGNYDATSFQRSWAFGDDGPVENAWRTSSAYPFSIMRLLALTKPAKFFSLFADRDRYKFSDEFAQYLWDGRFRLDAKNLDPLYGDGISKASFINWIIDYRRQTGINSTTGLETDLDNIDVRLCYRIGAFTDKRYLKIYTERSTPTSLNASLLLPDESYQVLLYKNQPFEQVTYSSVIVQIVEDGYAVFGYSTARPYFNILTSIPNGNFTTVSAGGSTARVALDHSEDITQVPYGYVFRNRTAVVDFLFSYGKLLEQQGFVFSTRENGYVLNWLQMAQEFLYWSNQGWAVDSIINLNPGATKIEIGRPRAVVDSIADLTPENLVLNQNRQPLSASDLVIDRIGNDFSLISLTNNTINFTNLKFTAYEHMVILDNVSIFADLIYDPVTGSRQNRVLVSGSLSADWTGLVNAPGFMLNEQNIAEWIPNRQYTKGTIVLFKNEYWTASDIILPTQEFDYSQWIKTESDRIQTGLLPNAANASDQLATAYSVYDANLEQEVDLFSYGLIGFRPREYMQLLNLDDVSQVGLYQQFLGTKGTRRSLEFFSLADLGKETAQYEIYEYWAILRGTYGANGNRNYYELRLNEALLRSDPSLVQVIEPGQASQADQKILLQNVWKTSTPLTSTNILPTTLTPPSQGFPTAGYVNLEDVDFTVFDLRELNALTVRADREVTDVGVGSLIWVAKTNAFDWNVYRTDAVPGVVISVTDNLNLTSLVTMSRQHGLVADQIVIMRFFNPSIDGFYRVLSVPSLTSFTIDFTFTGGQTTATGEGVLFSLVSTRVDQAADIAGLAYAKDLLPGTKVWVDDDGSGRWTVLEKTDPFVFQNRFEQSQLFENSRFGSSVTQGLQNLSAMVGAPGYNPAALAQAPGAVYTFVKTDTNRYQPNTILQLGTTGTAGYGNAMDSGNQTWAVVGASKSSSDAGYAVVVFNPPTASSFLQWQLLVIPVAERITAADEFGYSVTVSQDEKWIYVGAPGANRVYAYGLVPVQEQSVRYLTDGVSRIYNWSNSVVIDPTQPAQLLVVLDNVTLVPGVDYVQTTTDIILNDIPTLAQVLTMTRRDSITTFGDGSTVDYSLDSLYSVSGIDSFSVYKNNILQRPTIDYTYNGGTNDVTFTSAPTAADIINVRVLSYYKRVGSLTVGGLSASDRFGHSVSCTADGRQVMVGCPDTDSDRGRVYVFDRSVQKFQVTDADTVTYTTEQSPVAPVSVKLNGSFLLDSTGSIGGNFTVAGSDITVDTALSVGDILEIETNVFRLVQELQSARPFQGAKFGYATDQCVNNCSLYIGAPFDSTLAPEAGQVELFQNQSRIYGTTTSTVANPVLTSGDFLRIDDFFVQATGTSIEDLKEDIDAASIPNVSATLTPDLVLTGDGVNRAFNVGNIYSVASSVNTRVLIDGVVQTVNTDYTYDSSTEIITFTSPPLFGAEVTVISGRLTIAVKNPLSAVAFNKVTVLPGTGTLFSDLGFDTFVDQQIIVSPVLQDYAHFGEAIFISDSTVDLIVGAPQGSLLGPCTFDSGTTVFDAGSTEFSDSLLQSGAVYVYDFLPAANASVTNPGQFVFGQQIYNDQVASQSLFGTAVDYTTGTLLIGAPSADLQDSTADYGSAFEFINPNQSPAWQILRRQTPVVDISLLNTVFMYDRISSDTKQYLDYFDPLQGRLLGAVRQNLDYISPLDPAAYNVGQLNNYGNRWAQERVGQLWWDTAQARFIDPNQDDVVYASRRWGQLFPGSSIDVYQWVASSVPPDQYQGAGTPRSVTSYSIVSNLDEQGIFGTTYYFWVSGIREVARTAKKTLSAATVAQYIENPRGSGISYIAPINSSTTAIYNALEYIVAEDTILHIEYEQEFTENTVHVQYQLLAQDRARDFLSPALYSKFQDSFCGVDTVGNLVPDPFLPESEKYGVDFRPRQSMFVNRFSALQNYLETVNAVMLRFPLAETRRITLLDSAEPEPSVASGAWNKRVLNYEELTFQDLAQVPLGYKYLVASDSTNNGLWTIYETVPGALPGSKSLLLVRVQNFDTRLYWQYVDWYLPGYDPFTVIFAEVPNFSALQTITVPEGSSVKITANAQGKSEIYRLEAGQWIRVSLQDGTIQIKPEIWDYNLARFGFDAEVFDSQYFDQEPVIETRRIIQAINQQILIDDLAIERNNVLILMFNYILKEQIAPLWLTKTSLIDVAHVIRELEPFQIYRQDNQDFVLDYIQEVKPYHTQIREFGLIYQGQDIYQGSLTDFDLPAFWDANENLFVSPVLDNSVPPVLSTTSSRPSTDPIWSTFPWDQWYSNYLLEIINVVIADGGEGYVTAPQVVVSGNSTEPAVMTARIDSAGQVVQISVINPGQGYSVTAHIALVGGVPEATSWQPNTAVFAGQVLITPQRNIFQVDSSGVTGPVPPYPESQDGSSLSVLDGTAILSYLARQAAAVAVMGNGLVRDINTTIKYDRYQYQTTIVDWQPNVNYDNGTQVRYDDRVWSANSDDSTGVESQTFDPTQWTLVPAGSLSGVDRTMGYYVPDVNEPGLDLALLISGVDYPGVQVKGVNFDQNTGFDVGNYDINPFDNISIGPEGLPTYDPAILDTIYESEFTDPYLGVLPAPAYSGDPPNTGPNPIVVAGGAFVDTYSSHAPEELVPGAIFDTLDFRVYTTPGSDWAGNGHGFPTGVIRYSVVADGVYSFADLVDFPVILMVWNQTSGLELLPDVHYRADWPAQTVTLLNGASLGDIIVVQSYALGGGNQIYTNSFLGDEVLASVVIPVEFSLIQQLVIFANGSQVFAFNASAQGEYNTRITFPVAWTQDDRLTITALGTTDTSTPRSWSAPVSEYFVADGGLSFVLTRSLAGTNPANVIVERNGERARPAEGIEWIADGSSLQYYVPDRGGYNQALIADNEVSVYLDNQPLIQSVDYVVDPSDGSSRRTITLSTLPPVGAQILISVNHAAVYTISGQVLTFKATGGFVPSQGDIVTVTTFNDTSEQNILTQVFQGPESQGLLVSEGYDSTDFDVGNVSGEPGSYDYSTGIVVQNNRFNTGRIISNASRLEVTLNGVYLFEGAGFVVDGTVLEVLGPPINTLSVVTITSYTQSVVPGAIAFRIFQDMRGQQATYRITNQTTTKLAQPLLADADTIFVEDASRLSEPNLPEGIFGLITINGERITYRSRNTFDNTLTGLRRGTAGTAAADHLTGTEIYDIGLGNLLPVQYQDQVIADNTLADGQNTVFVAENITIESDDSTEIVEAIEVYVGGILQQGGYVITGAAPVTVVFSTAPTAGYQVSIRIRQGLSWYQPGPNTASDGIALQEQQTLAARFIRGI